MGTDRRCDNCIFSTFASGRGRATLICRQEKGHEGRWKAHGLLEKCENFHPSRAASADSSRPRLIPLTRGKFAVVDAEDYPELSKFIWFAAESRRTCYAVRWQDRESVKMHREIIKAPADLVVDHKDHDGLNNCRSNLRLATRTQNCQNARVWSKKTSKYKGVVWHKRKEKWAVRIAANKKTHRLGYFESEIEAAKAYDEAAKRIHGEFAALNLES